MVECSQGVELLQSQHQSLMRRRVHEVKVNEVIYTCEQKHVSLSHRHSNQIMNQLIKLNRLNVIKSNTKVPPALTETLQQQDYVSQVRPLNLRHSRFLHLVFKGPGRVQPETFPSSHSARTACSLIGRSLTNGSGNTQRNV